MFEVGVFFVVETMRIRWLCDPTRQLTVEYSEA